MPTANKITWARQNNSSSIENELSEERWSPLPSTIHALLLLLQKIQRSCYHLLPSPPSASFRFCNVQVMLSHKFKYFIEHKNEMEPNWKLSTGSNKRTCPYQLLSPQWHSNHHWCQLLKIDQESVLLCLCESTWKSIFLVFTNLYCHQVLARKSLRRRMSCPIQT